MPSPFPGMNPYLEQALMWVNFHNSLITAIRDRIAPLIEPQYFVALEEHVYIHELPEEPRRIGRPDLSPAVLEAPARGMLLKPVEVDRVPYLEILDRAGDRVVTVIEVLSPSNKGEGGDRERYLDKRREVLESQANLVEIDLLRGGAKLPMADYPACDYSVMISRPATRPIVDVWPVKLRERLPRIPIPLQGGADEPRIDLQELVHHVYDAGRLRLRAYRSPPEPPLAGEDAAWAEAILATT
jgi:hypothetical protein